MAGGVHDVAIVLLVGPGVGGRHGDRRQHQHQEHRRAEEVETTAEKTDTKETDEETDPAHYQPKPGEIGARITVYLLYFTFTRSRF